MADLAAAPRVLLLAGDDELDFGRRVWGVHDRSLPAASREALDWLTLCRFLGWEVDVEPGPVPAPLDQHYAIVIVARDPAAIGADEVAVLERHLTGEPGLVLMRAAARDAPVTRLTGVATARRGPASGHPRWVGPGPSRRWSAGLAVETASLELGRGAFVWAFVGGRPLAAGRRVGRGAVASLAAHPSLVRDAGPSGTGLLRWLLVCGAPAPLAWLDLEGGLVSRMDDPGSAANVHLRSWRHRELGEREWGAICAELEPRDARLSACYVPGWLDDGDPARGELRVEGEPVERVPGRVHPSPIVSYRPLGECAGDAEHDYVAGFRGLQELRRRGAGDVEQHGYTHVRPDHASWAAAPDRYENAAWYREFEGFGADDERRTHPDPIAAGAEILERFLGARPTTLSCPAQACSEAAVDGALGANLKLVATLTLAIRAGQRFCWSSHVETARIEEPDPGLLESGLPVVAALHDRDVLVHGASWIGRWLDAWREAGARRLLDFRELAAALDARLGIGGEGALLAVSGREGIGRPRELPVAIRWPRQRAPKTIAVEVEGGRGELPVEPLAGGAGRVLVPPS